jgi:hypothetical protein
LRAPSRTGARDAALAIIAEAEVKGGDIEPAAAVVRSINEEAQRDPALSHIALAEAAAGHADEAL